MIVAIGTAGIHVINMPDIGQKFIPQEAGSQFSDRFRNKTPKSHIGHINVEIYGNETDSQKDRLEAFFFSYRMNQKAVSRILPSLMASVDEQTKNAATA